MNTEAATALYRVAVMSPCWCTTKWGKGERVLVTECYRCKAICEWEAANNLPPAPRIGLQIGSAA